MYQFVCCNNSNNASEFGNRILNGIRADDYQFPYQVSIQKHKKHHCGGSIISEVKVLTAGHCVTSYHGVPLQSDLFRILAGSNKLNSKDMTYFDVKDLSVHPEFDRSTIQYDYAVMFIEGNFDFRSKRISMIPLATQNPTPGTVCYLSGWGDVEISIETSIPNELQFARITIDPPEACTKIYEHFFSTTHMLCAGRSNKENAGCGDSGGPLCCNNKLNGIVSFGRELYDSNLPDVYSSVVYAFDWINNTTSGLKTHTTVNCVYTVTMFIALLVTQILFFNRI